MNIIAKINEVMKYIFVYFKRNRQVTQYLLRWCGEPPSSKNKLNIFLIFLKRSFLTPARKQSTNEKLSALRRHQLLGYLHVLEIADIHI